MTQDEAVEAGALVKALEALDEALDDLKELGKEPEDFVGISLDHEHSDAGATGIGRSVIIPRSMVDVTMTTLGLLIRGRLKELGVDV